MVQGGDDITILRVSLVCWLTSVDSSKGGLVRVWMQFRISLTGVGNIAGEEIDDDSFGSSMAINKEGNRILVGSLSDYLSLD